LLSGQKVGVYVQPSHGFRPPSASETPLIMVGPGTGNRAVSRLSGRTRRDWPHRKKLVVFGDQKRETDFLYQTEIENYLQNGVLSKLDLAFSRDQSEKIYVQHRMLEQGAELWRWLDEGAYFTVCGDASRMAKDVDAALHQISRHARRKGRRRRESVCRADEQRRALRARCVLKRHYTITIFSLLLNW
jgi:sulfite reductase (NADPH) flavoprotein alpha-component